MFCLSFPFMDWMKNGRHRAHQEFLFRMTFQLPIHSCPSLHLHRVLEDAFPAQAITEPPFEAAYASAVSWVKPRQKRHVVSPANKLLTLTEKTLLQVSCLT